MGCHAGGWHKIIDFHNLASNVGLYTANSGLHFLNGPFTANLFTPNTLARLVLTRDDSTDTVPRIHKRTEIWNFIDAEGDAVFDGPTKYIRFFQDDNVTAQSEAQGGSVDLIRLYDEVLAPRKSRILIIRVPKLLTNVANRLRIRDGNGVGGALLDIGSLESQSISNAPPVITSPTMVSVIENSTDVIPLTATDSDMPRDQ